MRYRRSAIHNRLAKTFVILAFGACLAGASSLEETSLRFMNDRPALPGIHAAGSPTPGRDDLLVIGGYDPFEVVTITGEYTLDGSIMIVNHGTLELIDANLSIRGDITLVDDGTLLVSGANLTFSQLFGHQYGILAWDRAELVMTGAVVSGAGSIISGHLAGETFTRLEAGSFVDGMTVSVSDSARLDLDGMSGFIEAVVFDGASLEASDSPMDLLLVWLTLPAGAAGTFALPPWGHVSALDFPNDFPGTTGFDYSVSISNTDQTIFPVFSFPGSNITISNSVLLAAGLFIDGDGTHTLTDLENFSDYSDFTPGLEDRTLRLVDTELMAWNVYTAGTAEVSIIDSTVGEIFSMGEGTSIVYRSTCDGNGGYVSAQGLGQMFIAESVIVPRIVTTDLSVAILSESELQGEVFVNDASITGVVNAVGEYRVTPLDAGVVIEGAIDEPDELYTESEIEITGTSAVETGPHGLVSYTGYEVAFGVGTDPAAFSSIGTPHAEKVRSGRLETWNTQGLPPGMYTLRLLIYFDEKFEPAEVLRTIRLDDRPGPCLIRVCLPGQALRADASLNCSLSSSSKP